MDRITKVTLMLIAAGLWANAAVAVIRPALAAPPDLERIGDELQKLRLDFDKLLNGGFGCNNQKLC
jgi:hypothetical protein